MPLFIVRLASAQILHSSCLIVASVDEHWTALQGSDRLRGGDESLLRFNGLSVTVLFAFLSHDRSVLDRLAKPMRKEIELAP